ncbi:MAG: PKD domain-containing protein, partial [Limisphaerales bacterium]
MLLAASAAQAQFSFTTNMGTISITGYTGPGGVVTVPSWINGLPVTTIAGGAISSMSTTALTVTIPGSVTNIGDYAFASDYGLASVYFEGNAPSAGSHVFFDDNLLGLAQTAYYLSGATGWSTTVGAGVPTSELAGIAITANSTNGLEPLAVGFTAAGVDSGGHTVTNWNWDFGDGSTGTAQNPSHTYSTSGTFSVALVENRNGVPIAGAAMSIMAVPLTVAFTADPTNGPEPLTVNFTSVGVDNGGHTITQWNWDFGDGSTSAAQNPTHTYTRSGTFSVALVATNNLGLVVAGSSQSVTVSPLTVAFGGDPASGIVPLTVSFTSAGFDSGGNPLTNWNWSFGDNSTSTAQNPSHTYTNRGSFSVALIATNSLGYTVLGSGPASILALPPPQDEFTFTTNNGTITINSYIGSGGRVTIPGWINGLPVTSIAGYAINDLFTTAITVTIPASVTNIGDYAFEFNYSLASVYFGGNAPSAGLHVFFGDNVRGVTPTAYYLPGATGWSTTIGAGVPT